MARRFSADQTPRAGRFFAALLSIAPLFFSAGTAHAALQSLDDETLSASHAQDGVRIEFGDTGSSTMTQFNWITDSGAAAFGACTGGVAVNIEHRGRFVLAGFMAEHAFCNQTVHV